MNATPPDARPQAVSNRFPFGLHRMRATLFSEWALLVIAGAIVAMTVFPWQAAKPNTYDGFDKSLLFIDRQSGGGSGVVSIDPTRAVLSATPQTQPTIHLITSLTKFSARFEASITSVPEYSGTPLEIRAWYPGSRSSVFIRFNSAHQIVGGTQEEWRDQSPVKIASYRLGSPTQVEVLGDPGKSVQFNITAPDGASSTYRVTRESDLSLFRQPFLDLSVGSLGSVQGTASVILQNFRLTTPTTSYLTSRINDPRASIASLLIVTWFVAYMVRRRHSSRRGITRPRRLRESPRPKIAFRRPMALLLLGALGFFALVGALAFIDGHPYDRLSQETWSYVIQHYGLGSLYDRTITAPDSAVRGGGPAWSTLGYSYPPGMIYPYAFFAGVWQVVGGAISPLHDQRFYVFWKFCFSMFILLDGWLIYLFATRLTKTTRRWALVAATLFILNPAVIFDAAVWGETDALLTAALLVAAFGFLGSRPRLGFAGVAIACLLKQTALFFLPLFLVYSIKRYGLRQSLQGGAFGIVVGFIFIVPTILAGYHPGTAYPEGLVQLKSFALPQSTWVSGDTFSLWTLLTPLGGYHGFDRVWPPTLSYLPGTRIGYSTIGSVLFLAVVAVSLLFVLKSPSRRLSSTAVLRWAGLVPLAFVIFSTTGTIRYMTLGLPFLLLSIRRPASIRSAMTLVIVSATSAIGLLSMYGLFSVIADRREWPNFNGLGNARTDLLTGAVHAVYTSDIGITLFAIALLASAAATALLAIRPESPPLALQAGEGDGVGPSVA